jgi:molybdenum cofactor cytidylyltransferase
VSRQGESGRPVLATAAARAEAEAKETREVAEDTETLGFVSGVILAAGQARRMGATKQLLDWKDGTILQTVIDNARASRLDEVIVVLGHDAERIRNALALPSSGPLRAVVQAKWKAGASRSLRSGLTALEPESRAAAVLLGDQPGVGPALIDRVLAALPGCEKPIHRPIHLAPGGGTTPGHPVVLSRSIFAEAAALSGDEGARALLRDHQDWLCAVEIDGAAPDDIDTPEDYARLREGTH